MGNVATVVGALTGANSLQAKPGQPVTLDFTPTVKGTFEYGCTIPGHKEAGMKDKLNVAQ